jgi:hypothetical protein
VPPLIMCDLSSPRCDCPPPVQGRVLMTSSQPTCKRCLAEIRPSERPLLTHRTFTAWRPSGLAEDVEGEAHHSQWNHRSLGLKREHIRVVHNEVDVGRAGHHRDNSEGTRAWESASDEHGTDTDLNDGEGLIRDLAERQSGLVELGTPSRAQTRNDQLHYSRRQDQTADERLYITFHAHSDVPDLSLMPTLRSLRPAEGAPERRLVDALAQPTTHPR